MSWIGADEWVGSNLSRVWASDGQEIFEVQYRESDLCQLPEERLFIKLTQKVWLPVVYIWKGEDKPSTLPERIFSVARDSGLFRLLSHYFPDLDKGAMQALYSRIVENLPRLPRLKSMAGKFFFSQELPPQKVAPSCAH